MSGRYNVPHLVGTVLGRDHQMWPTTEDPLFSNIIAEASGFDPINVHHWSVRRASLAQLIALSWRVSEWTLSGTWGMIDDAFLEPGHIPNGYIQVDNSFFGSPAKVVFSTMDNTFTNWTQVPVVDEKRLVWESFGPAHTNPPTTPYEYVHDFGGWPSLAAYHSWGASLIHGSPRLFSTPLTSFITDGTVSATHNDGSMSIKLFQDTGGTANFLGSRGCDQVRFHAVGDGPSGPSGAPSPEAFDVFFKLVGVNGGAQPYCSLYTILNPSTSPPDSVIVIDPGGIASPINVDAVVLSASAVIGGSFERVSQYCDVRLTATKFFEYCNRNGDPVFDETTGAQINDPFL